MLLRKPDSTNSLVTPDMYINAGLQLDHFATRSSSPAPLWPSAATPTHKANSKTATFVVYTMTPPPLLPRTFVVATVTACRSQIASAKCPLPHQGSEPPADKQKPSAHPPPFPHTHLPRAPTAWSESDVICSMLSATRDNTIY